MLWIKPLLYSLCTVVSVFRSGTLPAICSTTTPISSTPSLSAEHHQESDLTLQQPSTVHENTALVVYDPSQLSLATIDPQVCPVPQGFYDIKSLDVYDPSRLALATIDQVMCGVPHDKSTSGSAFFAAVPTRVLSVLRKVNTVISDFELPSMDFGSNGLISFGLFLSVLLNIVLLLERKDRNVKEQSTVNAEVTAVVDKVRRHSLCFHMAS